MDLTYQGDAHLPSDSTYLRLTKKDDSGTPLSDSAGRVLYSSLMQFWKEGVQVDLETTIKFIITPTNDHPIGDDLVFFIAPLDPPSRAATLVETSESLIQPPKQIPPLHFRSRVRHLRGRRHYRTGGDCPDRLRGSHESDKRCRQRRLQNFRGELRVRLQHDS
ncbi:hypothetical protein C2S52_006958 [Perilla frutescens var. hirtella]|nr:hypothetical protein C2S52_006958 [Perilla frutescens var. hirtella]